MNYKKIAVISFVSSVAVTIGMMVYLEHLDASLTEEANAAQKYIKETMAQSEETMKNVFKK